MRACYQLTKCSALPWLIDKRSKKTTENGGELRQLCANLVRQCAVSTVQLHRFIQKIARPELCAPERSYQFKVEQWDKTEDHVICPQTRNEPRSLGQNRCERASSSE